MTSPVTANWWASSGAPAPPACLQFVDASNATNLLTFSVIKDESWTEDAEVTEHPVEMGANIADHVRVALVKCELKVFNTNEPNGQSVNLGSYSDQPTTKPLSLPVNLPTWQLGAPLTLTYPTWENNILARALLQTATGGIGSAIGGAGGAIGSAVGGLLGALLLAGHEVDATVTTDAGLSNDSTTWPTALTEQWSGDTDYVAAMHAKLVQLKNSAQLFTVFGSKRAPLYPMVIESLTFSRSSSTGSGEEISIGLKEVRQVTTQTVPAPIPALSSGGGTPPASHGGQDPTPAQPAVSVGAMIVAGGEELYADVKARLSGTTGAP